MSKAIKYIPVVCFVLFMAIAGHAQNSPQVKTVAGVKVVNFAALEPMLQTSSDTTYIVNFWATWCAPCIKELPYFQKVHEKYAGAKVKVILVSLDFEKQIESRLVPFLKKNDLKPEVIVLNDPASNTWINKIDPSWSGAIPATLFINKNGKRFYEKEFTYDEITKIIFEMNPQLR